MMMRLVLIAALSGAQALVVGSARVPTRVRDGRMVESWYDSGVRLRDEEAAAAPEAAPYVPQTTSIAGKASDAAIVGALQYGPAIIGIAVLLFRRC